MALERLIVSCGGTGGHFYPGLSVAREFQNGGGKVKLLLSGVNAVQQSKIAESFGIASEILPKMPHPFKSPVKFVIGISGGFFRSLRLLRSFAPQAMLGMGSFAMLPVVIAAICCRIPLVLHDGNARIGKANRKFSRFARFLGTAFPAVNGAACKCRCECTGMPIRPELAKFRNISKAEALAGLEEKYGVAFSVDKPVLLIVGGSQGAEIFNREIPAALAEFGNRFQVLHLAGKNKTELAAAAYGKGETPVLLLESAQEMELFYGAADIVFSRSGGSTAAELALFGKAAVLVPYPYAAELHQNDNADFLVSRGAAYLVDNSFFTSENVSRILNEFCQDQTQWKEMAQKAAEAALPEASQRLLMEISALCD